MKWRSKHQGFQQAGVTLVELIVSIVVISVGLAGVLVVMDRTTASSADPMVQHQAVAVAEAYLEEILARDFAGPDGTDATFGPEAGESRATFDSVNDYHNLSDSGARDQNDQAIAALTQYSVSVTVTPQALNDITAASGDAVLVAVSVAAPGGTTIRLSGYRTNYN